MGEKPPATPSAAASLSTARHRTGPAEPSRAALRRPAPFPPPAASVHHANEFVSGLEGGKFPALKRGLNYIEASPFDVLFDVKIQPDGSSVVTDQRGQFLADRFGMGVLKPMVGRWDEPGGVYRVDMSPINASTPNPNVVKMQEYAFAHPLSGEAKVRELERRWDADPLLQPSYLGASAHDRLDAPFGGPSSKHCDAPLNLRAETRGRAREVSKDASGDSPVTAQTKFTFSPEGKDPRLFSAPDPRRQQQAVASVPMGCTYFGDASAMGAAATDATKSEYIAHEPRPAVVEDGGGVWIFGSIRDRIGLNHAALCRKVEITNEYMVELGITREMTKQPWHFELPHESKIVYHPDYVAQLQAAAKAEEAATSGSRTEGDEEAEGEEAGGEDERCTKKCWLWGNKSEAERRLMARASAASNANNALVAAPSVAAYFSGGVAAAEACLSHCVGAGILREVATEQLLLQKPADKLLKTRRAQAVDWEKVEPAVLQSLAERASQANSDHGRDNAPSAEACAAGAASNANNASSVAPFVVAHFGGDVAAAEACLSHCVGAGILREVATEQLLLQKPADPLPKTCRAQAVEWERVETEVLQSLVERARASPTAQVLVFQVLKGGSWGSYRRGVLVSGEWEGHSSVKSATLSLAAINMELLLEVSPAAHHDPYGCGWWAGALQKAQYQDSTINAPAYVGPSCQVRAARGGGAPLASSAIPAVSHSVAPIAAPSAPASRSTPQASSRPPAAMAAALRPAEVPVTMCAWPAAKKPDKPAAAFAASAAIKPAATVAKPTPAAAFAASAPVQARSALGTLGGQPKRKRQKSIKTAEKGGAPKPALNWNTGWGDSAAWGPVPVFNSR